MIKSGNFRIIFIFIDGIGIGSSTSTDNPFLAVNSEFFPQGLAAGDTAELPLGGKVKAVDACLGIPGIPQSATGQSTLFCGLNAAKLMGRHEEAFPSQRLRAEIVSNNLLKSFRERGKSSVFFNCYPGIAEVLSRHDSLVLLSDGSFFSQNISPRMLKRISVTTCMALSIRQKFFGISDLKNRKCLYQDFTNESLLGNYPGIPVFEPEEAGSILARAHREYDLLLYEYFRTDIFGHKADLALAHNYVTKISDFLKGILYNIDLKDTVLAVCSDHGNLEDASTTGHTLNPVPLMIWGPLENELTASVGGLADITPALIKAAD